MKRSTIALIIVFGVLLIDQIIKFWVKTHMYLGQEIPIFGNWFIINFIENEGMAFGMRFGGEFGKIVLSVFRILAVGAIGYYLVRIIKKQENKLFIALIALLFAGAMGNVIDGAFYGLIFNESHYGFNSVAQFMPPEGGYASFLHGKVVDMFYFPIIDTTLMGKRFIFFSPVFNFADAAISVAVILMLIFSKKLSLIGLKHNKKEITEETSRTNHKF